jgi:hypothetical protein
LREGTAPLPLLRRLLDLAVHLHISISSIALLNPVMNEVTLLYWVSKMMPRSWLGLSTRTEKCGGGSGSVIPCLARSLASSIWDSSLQL